MSRVAGVDIAGSAAHVVMLEGADVAKAGLWPTDDLVRLAEELATCGVVAIDSPDRWSPGAIPEHEGLSTKFLAARCAEYELARRYRYWVPWVTPLPPRSDFERAKYAWMARGMELFQLLGRPRGNHRGVPALNLSSAGTTDAATAQVRTSRRAHARWTAPRSGRHGTAPRDVVARWPRCCRRCSGCLSP